MGLDAVQSFGFAANLACASIGFFVSLRAVGELRLRLADLLGETIARAVTAATFHSVCARLLREHASLFGRTENYTIYDQADVRRVIAWLLSGAERSQVQQAVYDHGQHASAELLAEISRAKSTG
jgi:DNA helicase-2/ATP-dependent DNA helicase PcrA